MVEQIHLQMRAMQALSKSQDMTADNLANLNTPVFKGNKIFYELYTEEVDGKRISQGLPMQTIDMSQGVLEGTGNSFDIAIEGDGFFTVQEGDRKYQRSWPPVRRETAPRTGRRNGPLQHECLCGP